MMQAAPDLDQLTTPLAWTTADARIAGCYIAFARWLGVGQRRLLGLPLGALVVPASTHESHASELMLEHLTGQGGTGRLELVLVDRGVTRPPPAG